MTSPRPQCTGCAELRRLVGEITDALVRLSARVGRQDAHFDTLLRAVELFGERVGDLEQQRHARRDPSDLDRRLKALASRVRDLEGGDEFAFGPGPWSSGHL